MNMATPGELSEGVPFLKTLDVPRLVAGRRMSAGTG
jgi:hypothetical protein